MLDLIEGAKIINGVMGSTRAATTAIIGDVINTENLHCVWAICSERDPSSGSEFTGWATEEYTGATLSRATCQYWRSTGILIDKMTASTQTTGLQVVDAVGGIVVIRYDPASRANSSQQYFVVGWTSGQGPKNVTYIGQPRYSGLGQILATSSST